MPPAVEHDSSRFDRRGWISPPDGEEEEEEEEKNAPVITRLRDDQKEACRYLQPRARGTDRAATRSIVPLLSRTGEPQPSAEQFSFFKQRQYVGSWVTALARNSYTHGRRRRCGGKEGGRGEGDGVVCRRYRVKFSAEYKGPSRAWPKAGFTALLVNLAVCAYIFKTHFDPTRLEGIALSETILYLFLPPPPSRPHPALPTLPSPSSSPPPPQAGSFFFLFTRGRGGEARVHNGYDVVGDISRELAPSLFSVRPSCEERDAAVSANSSPPRFSLCPSHHLARRRARRGPIKLLVAG